MVDTHSIQRQILLPYVTPEYTAYSTVDSTGGRVGVPVSPQFGDVYFSPQSGVGESFEHFIVGNDLVERFKALADGEHFTILETGFGSGLNLVVVADTFLRHAPHTAHLHFVSCEGYPLHPDDMRKILDSAVVDSGIRGDLVDCVLGAYPVPCRGFHYAELACGRVHLNLYMGDVADFVGGLCADYGAGVDAVFLDGFAPAKNADMWAESVLARVGGLMKRGGTVATFTSAGFVRRGLESVGFDVRKTVGYGRKRERIVGVYTGGENDGGRSVPKTIAVIGAGIAGLTIARACQQWGADVVVYDGDDCIMGGASGNPVGLIEPRIINDNDATAHGVLNRSAYLHSVAYYNDLARQCFGKKDIWSCRGMVYSPPKESEQKRLAKIKEKGILPYEHLQFISHGDAEKLVGGDVFPHAKNAMCDGGNNGENLIAYFPQAGGVYPRAVGDVLANDLDVRLGWVCDGVMRDGTQWILVRNNGEKSPPVDAVIVCAGVDSLHMGGVDLGDCNIGDILRANRGQISWIDGGNKGSHILPKIAVGGQGYCAYDFVHNRVVFGATWDRVSGGDYASGIWRDVCTKSHGENQEKVSALMPRLSDFDLGNFGGRVAVRATVPDRMPLVGFVADGLFLATGYGARGLQYAPLLSHICRHMLWKIFPPCFRKTVFDLNPLRFNGIGDFDKNTRGWHR